MLQQYSQNELQALKKLADYRNIFSVSNALPKAKRNSKPNNDTDLPRNIEQFIELFCGHNFADTDYSIIQNDQHSIESPEEWINNMSPETIMKCITYVIWTNKSIKGYFVKKINDRFLEKVLTRLNDILAEYNTTPPVPDKESLKDKLNGKELISKRMNGKNFIAIF
jgi:hypothetical protein